MMKRIFSIAALSDKGYVKKTNQDRILVKIGEDQFGEFGIFVVADGMGGLTAGDKASGIVVKMGKDWWDKKLPKILLSDTTTNIKLIEESINNLIKEINNEIIAFGKSVKDKVGTTLSILFLYRDKYLVKHIGDSRIYKINDNSIIQLTEDHTWVNQQVKQGKISKEEARKHPRRHVLTQCVGIKEDINIYTESDIVLENDVFLLCSDGLYGLLTEEEIKLSINRYGNGLDDIEEVINILFNKVKNGGASDNVSAILITQKYEKKKEKLLHKLKRVIGFM